jgi:hypothetical protein
MIDADLDVSAVYVVQAPNYIYGHAHSDSELARVVASNSPWRVARSGHLVDAQKRVIADTLAVAGHAMATLGWFQKPGKVRYIDWAGMPDDSEERAEQIRAVAAGQEGS